MVSLVMADETFHERIIAVLIGHHIQVSECTEVPSFGVSM